MAAFKNPFFFLLFIILQTVFKASGDDITDKILYGTTEYFYNDYNGDNFYEAREFCFSHGGDLVTIDTKEKHQFISEWMDNVYGDFWLGMRKDATGTYKWLNGSQPVTFANWAEDQYLDNDLLQCAYQQDNYVHTWLVGNCGNVENRVILCEREENKTEPIPTPAPTPLGYCPEGYVGFYGQEKCYQVNIRTAENGVTWNEARDICKSGPGFMPDLASFHNQNEIALVATQLTGRPMSLWIGKILGSEKWMWSDNSAADFMNWAQNEPKYSDESDDCAEMEVEPGPPGAWRSTPCNIRRGFICQIIRTPDDIIITPPTLPPNNCKSEYTPFGDSCYKLFENAVSWNDADLTCRQDGAFLVTVHSHEENAVVHLAAVDRSKVWIGLRDVETAREFFWTDDWPVIYTNWDRGEPSTTRHHDCAMMEGHGLWSLTNCEELLPFICKTSTATPPTEPPMAEGRCPDVMPDDVQWVEHGDYCYRRFIGFTSGETWLEALSSCVKLYPDASLVSIHHVTTNTFIRDLADENGDSKIWIGMHLGKGPDSPYQWIDGSPVQYVNWQTNYPDPNSGADMGCVTLATKNSDNVYQGTWREESCDNDYHFVCATKKIKPPSTPPPTGGDCPDGWDHYGDRCLYIAPNNLTTWYSATKNCNEMAGPKATLASIDDENINTLIRNALFDRSQTAFHRGFWLGGRSKDGDYPTWADGSSLAFENWEDNEPEIPSDHFACIEMNTFHGYWKLSDCQSFRGYACSVRKADIPMEGEENGNGDVPSGLTGSQSVGIAFGVILAVGLLASVSMFLVLRSKEQKLKDASTRNYINEFNDVQKSDTVNYEANTENVDIEP